MFKPSTVFASAVIAATMAAVPVTTSAANAQTTTQTAMQTVTQTSVQGSAAACRSLRVTGGNVAIREFPFTNGAVLRTVPTGTTFSTCELLRGNGSNGYASKCGRTGHNWYKVRSGRTTVTGSPFGYVPATCVRVL
ncbi:SH3 domain-containing protein [Nonomuraea sp. NPDC046802]|uniref:SH3 domain-containing protein n=1 Tax=Nonomuraea sp. NPDC046802 TaxID=3154919 RepID=UPI0033D250AF